MPKMEETVGCWWSVMQMSFAFWKKQEVRYLASYLAAGFPLDAFVWCVYFDGYCGDVKFHHQAVVLQD